MKYSTNRTKYNSVVGENLKPYLERKNYKQSCTKGLSPLDNGTKNL